jgi:purine-nucleoside phosphorylase
MMAKVPTPHIGAKQGEIAPTMLMPGDPLRAKFIAETWLEDAACVNTIRNMLAFTGSYQGKRVTVMGGGMGMPSVGLYTYELFHFYDVQQIAAALHSDINLVALKADTLISRGYRLRPQEHKRNFLKYSR